MEDFLTESISKKWIGLKQNSFFWYFLHSYVKDYLEFLDTPALPHSHYNITPNIKKKKREMRK